jgi:hypothetical protein
MNNSTDSQTFVCLEQMSPYMQLIDYHTSDHKKRVTDHYSTLMHSVNGAAVLNMSQYYHWSKDNKKN